jgi:hypothetical protein
MIDEDAHHAELQARERRLLRLSALIFVATVIGITAAALIIRP